MDSRSISGTLSSLQAGLEASSSGRFACDQQEWVSGELMCGSEIGRYKVIGELNRGATAVVYEAEKTSDHLKSWQHPVKVALKVFNSTSEGRLAVPAELVQTEIACLQRMQHPHIASLLDVVALGNKLALAVELVHGPDLLGFVESCGRRVPEDVAAHYFRQLLSAVRGMHEQGIAHRDIKPENCVIDQHSQTLKVVDFGLAAPLEDAVPVGCGTIYTVAPECITQDRLPRRLDATAVDAWGLGVTLFIMLAGKFPFQNLRRPHDDQWTIHNTLHGCMNPLPDNVSPAAKHLVASLLRTRPGDRPSLAEVAAHPFVTGSRRSWRRIVVKERQSCSEDFAMPCPFNSARESMSVSASKSDMVERYLDAAAARTRRTREIAGTTEQLSQGRQSSGSLQAEVVMAALQASQQPQSEDGSPPTPPKSDFEPRRTDRDGSPDEQRQEAPCSSEPSAPTCGGRAGARKLFTVSADGRTAGAEKSLPTPVLSKAERRLLPVLEVSESCEMDIDEGKRLVSIASLGSIPSWRSDATVVASIGDAGQQQLAWCGNNAASPLGLS